jgi:hypothetical protein
MEIIRHGGPGLPSSPITGSLPPHEERRKKGLVRAVLIIAALGNAVPGALAQGAQQESDLFRALGAAVASSVTDLVRLP